MVTKQQIEKIYKDAAIYFKETHPEWLCTLDREKNAFVIQYNWMDVTYFTGTGLKDEQKRFRFVITIDKDGGVHTLDVVSEDMKAVGLAGVAMSKSGFVGYSSNSHGEIVLFGKDKKTGEVGPQVYSFSTDDLKKDVLDYFFSVDGLHDAGNIVEKMARRNLLFICVIATVICLFLYFAFSFMLEYGMMTNGGYFEYLLVKYFPLAMLAFFYGIVALGKITGLLK